MLIEANLPNQFWGEAANTAAYIQNRLPSEKRGTTPYELWTGRKATIKHLQTFGCTANVHTHKIKCKSKLDTRAEKCILVGYCPTLQGYRLYHPKTKTMIRSRNVTFVEHIQEPRDEIKNPSYDRDILSREYQICQTMKRIQE